MPNAEAYASWIVANADKKGTPEFDTVAQAYQLARGSMSPAPQQSNAQSALSTFAQGATMGFGDELAGGVSALTGGEYESARKDFLAKQKGFADENPLTALGLEAAGGVATGLGGAVKLGATKAGAKLASLLPKWQQVAGAGGAAGAVAGAGNAEPGDRMLGAAVGAPIGAATGLVLPPALKLAGKGIGLATKAITTPLKYAAQSLRPEGRSAELLARNMARDGMTPDMINQRLAQMGPDATLADAGGENILGLAETAASIPGKAKNAASQVLEARAKSAQGRIVKDLMDNIGADDVNFDAAVGKLHSNMREIGKQYEPIMQSTNVDMNPNLTRLMRRPSVQAGLKQAARIAAEQDDDAFQKFLTMNDKNELDWAERPTLKAWDYVKRGLDDVIDKETDAITGKMTPDGRLAYNTKRELIKEVDVAAPEYAKVRALYADEKSAESALNMGRAFMRDDAEVTARRYKGMDAAEQKYFRTGAARAIYDKVMRSIDTGQNWRQLVKSPLIRDKIKEVFPDDASANKFLSRLETEGSFGRTRNTITGNSATARRLAGIEDAGVPGDMLANAATGNIKGLAAGGLRLLFKNATNMPEPVRNELADVMFTQDPAKRAAAMARVMAQKQFQPKTNWLASPGTAAVLGGQSYNPLAP